MSATLSEHTITAQDQTEMGRIVVDSRTTS